MSDLASEIAAFERMQTQLEADHLGEWVLIHNAEVISCFHTFHEAAGEAADRFGKGPYLIRQIGARQQRLPSSVLFHPVHAQR